MSDILVNLPDGKQVKFPAGTTPAEITEAINQAFPADKAKADPLSTLKKAGTSLMAGFGKTASLIPSAVGMMAPLSEKAAQGFSDVGSNTYDFWKTVGEKGLEEGYPRAIVEGIGGAAVTPVGMAGQPVRTLLGIMLGGAGGGAGAETGKRLLPASPQVGELLGGLVGGFSGAFLGGPRISPAKQDIQRELPKNPADWAAAEKNLATFNSMGATTATNAEAFPEKTRISALASNAANSKGGELLGERLSRRDTELTRLGLQLPELVSPNVSVPETARKAAEAAAARLGIRKQAAQRPLQAIARDEASGKLPPIPENAVASIFRDYESLSKKPMQWGADVRAMEGFLPEFLDPNAAPRVVLKPGPLVKGGNVKAPSLVPTEVPGFQQSLGALLGNFAENSSRATGPLATAGVTIPKRALSAAQKTAFDAAGTLPLPWGQRAMNAGANYLVRKNAWVTPAEEGTLGLISGNKNQLRGPISEGKLEAVLNDTLPGKTAATLTELGKGGANTKDIAAALMRKKLEGGPTDFPKALASNQGSDEERQLLEMLRTTGAPVGTIEPRLEAGRQLQQLSAATGHKGLPEMRTAQAFIRPFRTLDMILTGHTEKMTQAEIARLLSDLAPGGLAELRKIAMFDPNVRRQLTLLSALRPGLLTSQEK